MKYNSIIDNMIRTPTTITTMTPKSMSGPHSRFVKTPFSCFAKQRGFVRETARFRSRNSAFSLRSESGQSQLSWERPPLPPLPPPSPTRPG